MHSRLGLSRALQWHLGVLHVHGSNHGGTVFSGGLSLYVPAFIRMQCLVILFEIRSLRISHTALLCLLVMSAWMCWCLHFRSTCSHVSASMELQIGHV